MRAIHLPRSLAALVASLVVLGPLGPSALAAPNALPSLPPAAGGAAAPAPAAQGADASAAQAPSAGQTPSAAQAPGEGLRKGIVQVEQGGKPLAVGTVLSKDGRVITSLSAIGAVEQPEIRYADGSVVKAKVGHRDKGWDLALLIPQSGRWMDGLMPTDADPAGGEIKAFLPKAGKLAPIVVALKGRTDVRSKEGDALKSALDMDLKGSPSVPGAPLLDQNGRVVGVLVRACKEGATKDADAKDKAPACAPVTIGAPVYALRGFLMKTPQAAAMPQPWLGLGGAPTESGSVRGVRVVGVAPGSPAEKAGLKAAGDNPDTIVAVDGQPVETPEQLAETIAKHGIGQTVKLLVFSQGKFREAAVTLRPAP